MNNSRILLGGLTLAGVIAGVALTAKPEQPVSLTRREPELFSFVRPLPELSAPDQVISLAETGSEPMPQLRHLFDRMLNLYSGVSGTEIRQKIEQELERQIMPSRIAQARVLLEKYLHYKTRMVPIQNAIDEAQDVAGLRMQLQTLRELRHAIFSPTEIGILFPADETYEQVLLARLEINLSSDIAEEQKHARLLELETSLAPEVRDTEELRSDIVRMEPVPRVPDLVTDEEDIYRLGPGTLPVNGFVPE